MFKLCFSLLLSLASTVKQDNSNGIIEQLLNKTFVICRIPTPSVLDGKIQEPETRDLYDDFFFHGIITSPDRQHMLEMEPVLARIKFTQIVNGFVEMEYVIDSRDSGDRKVSNNEVNFGNKKPDVRCTDCNVFIYLSKDKFNDLNKVFAEVIRSLPTKTKYYIGRPYYGESDYYYLHQALYNFSYITGDMNDQRIVETDPCKYYYGSACYLETTDKIWDLRQTSENNPIPNISSLQWKSGNVMMVERSDLIRYLRDSRISIAPLN